MLVNGIPIDTVAINDRALSYGDGVFETILLHEGQSIYLQSHIERLLVGCRRLGIRCDIDLLKSEIQELSSQFSQYGVLKIVISRGSGGRGYRPDPSATAKRILTLHPAPNYNSAYGKDGIQTFLCQQRLALQASLAGIKHLNRLEQVLASQEWPGDDFQEGIMLDSNGLVIEGTRSNLFIVESGYLLTPKLEFCGVDGVMRKSLIEAFSTRVKIEEISLKRLQEATEVFVCNSIFGVWPVLNFKAGSRLYQYTPGEFCLEARQVFETALVQHAS